MSDFRIPDDFPVLMTPKQRAAHPLCPRAVPWGLVNPHDRQARRNHDGQDLITLARRGGLDPVELQAVLQDVPYPQAVYLHDPAGTMARAVQDLLARVRRFARPDDQRPVATVLPGVVWDCPVCLTTNGTPARLGGAPPVELACAFCKTVCRPPAEQ